MKILFLFVSFLLVVALACSGGLTEAEVQQIIDDSAVTGLQREPGPAGPQGAQG